MPKPAPLVVPDLSGTLAVVTGATDGVGIHIAGQLAAAGADLVLPARNPAKAERAAARLRERVPGVRIETPALELSSLASVAAFADGLLAGGRPVGILVNNAGMMNPPTRQVSVDGIELQLATNHLGHFALAARILPLLIAGRARVTSQVSVAANQNAVHWDDLNWEHGYDPMRAYSSSKIALGLAAMELQRRSEREGWGITSALSHPGVTPTNLLSAQPEFGRPRDTVGVRLIRTMSRLGVIVGTPETAAQSAVLAVTTPEAAGGRMFGPSGFQHLGGPPTEQPVYSRLLGAEDARRIWERSEQLAGVRFGG